MPGYRRDLDKLRAYLRRIRAGRPERGGADVVARRQTLGRFQCKRLKTTHGDLLAEPRYRPAVEFFFSDLYVTRDLTGRDHNLERMAPIMARTLPARALEALLLALEMEALTQDLDARLLARLDPSRVDTDSLDLESWIDAYRRCNDYDDRCRQVDLIRLIGRHLDRLVGKPGLRLGLRLCRGPTKVSGFGEMQDLLERGYAAFRRMKGADAFLDRIVDREHRIIERIRRGHSATLDLSTEPEAVGVP